MESRVQRGFRRRIRHTVRKFERSISKNMLVEDRQRCNVAPEYSRCGRSLPMRVEEPGGSGCSLLIWSPVKETTTPVKIRSEHQVPPTIIRHCLFTLVSHRYNSRLLCIRELNVWSSSQMRCKRHEDERGRPLHMDII